MRLCRFGSDESPRVGLYDERGLIPLTSARTLYTQRTRTKVVVSDSNDLLTFLPPDGENFCAARQVADWMTANREQIPADMLIDPAKASLLVPIPRPNKIFLLAGNYAEHIREGGGIAAEREETFPYVFMKPPSTTLTHPGRAIRIPQVSPGAIDWELELAVVIGRRVKAISEADALSAVAGYTVINDISNRRYQPNPERKPREKDKFFDWLHGKWFDSFCPCGPCVTSADEIHDPQTLRIKLTVNREIKQDGSTSQMIFPVAALIAFISQMVTLEPGDLISTGTPAGVGSTTGTFLKPGDIMHGSIDGIGTLVTPVDAE